MSARHVTFVIGRANTGKSAYLIESLRALCRQDARAIVLVPEQYTFETELRLSHALGGLMGIQVLSFERLSERVLALSGQSAPFLSSQGCEMVLRRTAIRCRERLTVFSRVASERGFAKQMNDVITACKRCCITPDALSASADKLPVGAPLRDKLTDVSLLYAESEDYLAKRYLSQEDALSAVLTLLEGSFVSDVPVFLDGFEGATQQHYKLLEKIMEVSASLTVTLRIDPLAALDADVFAPDIDAMRRLCAIAEKLHIPVRTVEKTEPQKRIAPAIAHLERNLYAYPAAIYPVAAPEVTLFGASSPLTEAEALADAVLTLVHDRGMRYRDIAVVASDLDAYASPVTRAFAKRGIPLFFDGKRPVRTHAVSDMLLASLRACANGFAAEDFLIIAKSGYAPVSDADADALQIFLERTGLRGNALLRPFSKADVPEGAERARAALAKGLLFLKDATSSGTASDKTRALYQYLLSCGVDEKLKEMANALARQGRTALADEHAQVWNVLMALLSQLDAILSDMPISRKDYLAVLEEGLDGYAIGVVPGTSDQVLLGDVLRTRSRSLRALFLVGCNDGLLPRTVSDDTLFNDRELAALSDAGLPVWLDTAQSAQLDRLDLYTLLGKATERISFSYAFAAGGSELAPSPLLRRIERLLPLCTMQTDLEQRDVLPLSEAEGLHMLSGDLALFASDGVAAPRLGALLQVFSEREKYAALVSRMASGRPSLAVSLPAPLARQLYGQQLTISASRLERFNACPMQHFLQYGLKAKEKRIYEERPADLGTLYHDVLDAFVKGVLSDGRAFETLADAEISERIEQILSSHIETHNDGFFLTNERQRASLFLLMDTLKQSASALVGHIRSGGFRPAMSETRFGEGGFFGAIPLALPDGTTARIEGIIDRVDTAAGGTNGLVRVVDYKTHGRAFDYTGLFYGLTLQLPLYLLAAARDQKTPAGMYYMPLDVPAPDAEESYEAATLRAFLLKGVTLASDEAIVTTDHKLDAPGVASDVVYQLRIKKDGTPAGELTDAAGIERILDAAARRATRALADMLAGRADALPVAGACKYCPYRAICRFDALLPACRVRKTEKLDRESFFRRIGGDEDAKLDK